MASLSCSSDSSLFLVCLFSWALSDAFLDRQFLTDCAYAHSVLGRRLLEITEPTVKNKIINFSTIFYFLSKSIKGNYFTSINEETTQQHNLYFSNLTSL